MSRDDFVGIELHGVDSMSGFLQHLLAEKTMLILHGSSLHQTNQHAQHCLDSCLCSKVTIVTDHGWLMHTHLDTAKSSEQLRLLRGQLASEQSLFVCWARSVVGVDPSLWQVFRRILQTLSP